MLCFFSKNHILFQFDQTLVLSRLIEGEYFKIDQMISSDFEDKDHGEQERTSGQY